MKRSPSASLDLSSDEITVKYSPPSAKLLTKRARGPGIASDLPLLEENWVWVVFPKLAIPDLCALLYTSRAFRNLVMPYITERHQDLDEIVRALFSEGSARQIKYFFSEFKWVRSIAFDANEEQSLSWPALFMNNKLSASDWESVEADPALFGLRSSPRLATFNHPRLRRLDQVIGETVFLLNSVHRLRIALAQSMLSDELVFQLFQTSSSDCHSEFMDIVRECTARLCLDVDELLKTNDIMAIEALVRLGLYDKDDTHIRILSKSSSPIYEMITLASLSLPISSAVCWQFIYRRRWRLIELMSTQACLNLGLENPPRDCDDAEFQELVAEAKEHRLDLLSLLTVC
jgi:hypothetical protein